VLAERYAEAILSYMELSKNSQLTVADYQKLGYSYIMTKQYLKAIVSLKEGEKQDASDLRIKSNLAHAYLLSGDVKAAKTIYSKYKRHNVDPATSWNELIKRDLQSFKDAGLPDDHFKSVLRLLK
jgi:Flp pilus assembly protein TadD